MTDITKSNTDYKQWLIDLKKRIKQSQLKAVVKVNSELISLYWSMGEDIVEKQEKAKWGDGFITQLSKDLKEEFPNMQGFSVRNIKYIRQWYLFYNQRDKIGQQAVAQLDKEKVQQLVAQIPWGHNLKIVSKCKTIDEALFYINKTTEFGWSRDMLDTYIKLGEHKRVGSSTTNFALTLPSIQSDLAQQTLKDPYNFDFLTLSENYKERELEDALTDNITRFLLELGSGFAYVGRQVPLTVGDKEFFIDLLFYHLKLRCYVVIELKAVDFIPEFAGKLSFYLSAVNDILAHSTDNPTIGLMICKSKNHFVAEYALKGINQPIGVELEE
ncbi:MAG: PDDEXK nuclease domain-containing protein [Dysgonomonas sp.]|nr:PDDEXK nuclease domain-containing protein [Dysgonomonas sp.]